MSEFSSSSVKETSKSSKKVSSSSVSSSSKVSSSSSLKSSSSIDMVDVDSLLSKSLASKLSSDLDEMKSKNSSLSSINQSSLDRGDGAGVKSSVTSHSSSSATSASLKQKMSVVDGQVVSAETAADKSAKKAESGKQKTMEDGRVTSDHGFNVEQTKEAKLRATKDMSKEELDTFFKQPAITGKSPEALKFEKETNSFEMKLTDLPQFSPQELTVKVVEGVITVVGTHEEVAEDGTTRSHNYIRRFTVPESLNAENVKWELEPSGVLAIAAGEYVKGLLSQQHLDCTIFKPRSFFKKS